MAELTIGDRTVTVDDSFLKLPPDQQHATVDHIATQLGVKSGQTQPANQSLTDKAMRIGANAISPITNYPSTYKEMVNESVDQMGRGYDQLTGGPQRFDPVRDAAPPDSGAMRAAKGVGNMALGAMGYTLSPVNAAIHSVVGKPVEDVTGIPSQYTDFAVGLAVPGLGMTKVPKVVTPPPTGPLGVVLSEGQRTRDLAALQREQAALRNTTGGEAAHAHAQEFAGQQATQVADATDRVRRGFDQFGAVVANSPQEAGEVVSNSVNRAATTAKANVTQLYDQAKNAGGDLAPQAFKGMGDSIKLGLSSGSDPIIINDKLTPFASEAIKRIDDKFSQMQIQNRASPFGQPPQNSIAGITLKGVDQMRRELVGLRKSAYAQNSDGQAMSAVVKEFDNHIGQAINGGLFNGSPDAINAWKTAREAHTDYRNTFTKNGSRDQVGAIVEKITGGRNGMPAQPSDVADFLWGSSGVNPSTLNVAVAGRVRGILGDASPEWSAVKQGMFSKLVETPQGVADRGPGVIANRISNFLNGEGRSLADSMFAPHERATLQQYAELQRILQVPQSAANWSNTASALAPILEKISNKVGAVIGGAIGHTIAPGAGEFGTVAGVMAGNKVSSMGRNASNAKQIAVQMPLVNRAVQQWTRQVQFYQTNQSQRSAAALSIATSRMSQALEKIGVDLRAIQSPAQSAAESDQNPEPRPPGQ